MLGSRLALALTAAVLASSTTASATYSIVASDRATRQVGGAGASCLGGADVYVIYGAVAGVGAVHAQAQFNQPGRERALQLLGQARSPAQVVAAITAPMFDAIAASRQYGVVDVTGQSAGFTGTSTLVFADDVQGSIGAFTYSIQGNILTGGAVLSQAVAGFEAPVCDLAARLLAALEAGGNNGEGDSRCTDDGIPSDSAFLQVDVPDAPLGSFLSLRVPSSGLQNPLSLLRAQFDLWRSSSPCPAVSPDSGASVVAIDSGTRLGVRDAASAPLPPTVSVPFGPPPSAAVTPAPLNEPSAPPPVVAPRVRSSGGCIVSYAGEPSTGFAGLGGLTFALSRRRLLRARARRPVTPV